MQNNYRDQLAGRYSAVKKQAVFGRKNPKIDVLTERVLRHLNLADVYYQKVYDVCSRNHEGAIVRAMQKVATIPHARVRFKHFVAETRYQR